MWAVGHYKRSWSIMYARLKKSKDGKYLQIVESYRDSEAPGTVKQRLVMYVGHYTTVAEALEEMGSKGWGEDHARDLADLEKYSRLKKLVDQHPEILAGRYGGEAGSEPTRSDQHPAFVERLEALAAKVAEAGRLLDEKMDALYPERGDSGEYDPAYAQALTDQDFEIRIPVEEEARAEALKIYDRLTKAQLAHFEAMEFIPSRTLVAEALREREHREFFRRMNRGRAGL